MEVGSVCVRVFWSDSLYILLRGGVVEGSHDG